MNKSKSTYTAKELLDMNITEIPSLVEPILPKVGIAAVTGSSDVGKSSFLRELAISIGLGDKDFLGFKLNATHKSTIYVATEDDASATAVMLKRALRKGKKSDDYEGVRFIFETNSIIKSLETELAKKPADCIIIDTYTDIFPGNMNQSNEVRTFLTRFKELAQKHSCLIIFLNHTGKRTEQLAPSKDNTLGSQGFEAKMRVLIEIRKDYNFPGKRHMCILKGNYLPESYKNKSYVLKFNADQTFTLTNQRVDFEILIAPNTDDIKSKRKNRTLELVLKLKSEGKTHKAIAEEVTKTGYSISKTTVSDWLRRHDHPTNNDSSKIKASKPVTKNDGSNEQNGKNN